MLRVATIGYFPTKRLALVGRQRTDGGYPTFRVISVTSFHIEDGLMGRRSLDISLSTNGSLASIGGLHNPFVLPALALLAESVKTL